MFISDADCLTHGQHREQQISCTIVRYGTPASVNSAARRSASRLSTMRVIRLGMHTWPLLRLLHVPSEFMPVSALHDMTSNLRGHSTPRSLKTFAVMVMVSVA